MINRKYISLNKICNIKKMKTKVLNLEIQRSFSSLPINGQLYSNSRDIDREEN